MKHDPDKLYHYTTAKGLIGIFTDKKIWATSINHLNDKKEFYYCIDMFRTIGESVARDCGRMFEYELMLKKVDDFSRKVFVTSFSEHRDQLSQWRGYSREGGGFSIGFDFTTLRGKIQKSGYPSVLLSECSYDEEELKQKVQGFVSFLKERNFDDQILEALRPAFPIMSPLYKSKAFREEAEWRIVAIGSVGEVKFRTGKTSLIPYCEIDLTDDDGKLIIDSVTIGPTPYEKESIRSLEMLFEKNGMSIDKIRLSEIPYREL